MQSGIGHPLEVLSQSLEAAIRCDLPGVEWAHRGVTKTIRPYRADVWVEMWPQTWSDTACMFDAVESIAGQAFTDAYIVMASTRAAHCVYCGGRLAYTVLLADNHERVLRLLGDVRAQELVGQRRAVERYGAILPEQDQ